MATVVAAVRRREAGFTLISVLIAVALLSVGLLSVTQTVWLVLRTNTQAGGRTVALDIARAYMEQMRLQDPSTLTSQSAVMVDASGQPNPAGQYTRSVNVEKLAKNLLRITVTVQIPRNAQSVQLVTKAFVPITKT